MQTNDFMVNRTFAMIKPDAYTSIGKIIDIIENSGFVIGNLKMAKLTLSDAQEFYAEHKVICKVNSIYIEFISSGKAILYRTYKLYLQRFRCWTRACGRGLYRKMESFDRSN